MAFGQSFARIDAGGVLVVPRKPPKNPTVTVGPSGPKVSPPKPPLVTPSTAQVPGVTANGNLNINVARAAAGTAAPPVVKPSNGLVTAHTTPPSAPPPPKPPAPPNTGGTTGNTGNTGSTGGAGGTGGTTGPDYGELINSVLGQINQTVNTQIDFAPIFAPLIDQARQELSQTYAQIQELFRSQLNADDPVLQSMFSQIDRAVQQQHSQLLDEMNRRGLLQSGIALEMESRLNQNALNAKEQAAADHFNAIISEMNQALVNLASQRLQIISGLTSQQAQAAVQAALARPQQALQAAQLGLQGIGLASDIQNQNRQFGLQVGQLTGFYNGQPTLAYQQFQTDTALQRAKLQQDAQQFAAQMGLNWAQLNQSQQQFLMDQAQRKYEFEQNLDLERQKLLQSSSVSSSATNQFLANVMSLPPAQRMAYYQSQSLAWAQQGADVNAVLNAILKASQGGL